MKDDVTLERIAHFMGEAARPFAIISTSASAAAAVVVIAWRVTSYAEGAAFIAAVFVGVGALYGAKAWENARNRRSEAEVEIARSRRADDPPAS